MRSFNATGLVPLSIQKFNDPTMNLMMICFLWAIQLKHETGKQKKKQPLEVLPLKNLLNAGRGLKEKKNGVKTKEAS